MTETNIQHLDILILSILNIRGDNYTTPTLAWSHTVAIKRLYSDGLYPVEDLGNSGVDPGVVGVATLDTLTYHANLNMPT